MTVLEPTPDEVTELLAALAMAAPVGGAILDEELRFLWINPLAAAINGRPVSEHAGRTLHDIIGPLADVVAPYFRQVFDTGEPVASVNITGELGGRMRSWEASYLPLRAGSLRAVGAVVTEVTERDAAQAEARDRASRQAAVARLGRRALGGAGIDELLDTTAAMLAAELRVDCVRVLELQPGGEQMLLRAGRGWEPGLIGTALVDASPGTHERHALETTVAVAGAGRLSAVIRIRTGPWGVLGVDARTEREFAADDGEFLQAVADVVSAAIDRDSGDRELERVAAQRRRLVAEALDAGERERRRVADQLHDHVLQTLLFARQECTAGLSGQDDEALARARGALEQATDEVRTIVGLLHPVTLAHAGFVAAVESFAREEAQRGGYAVDLDLATQPEDAYEQLLLGLVRELLVNVTKHAQASRASVSLREVGEAIVLEVTDNGVGLADGAVGEALAHGHVGLASAFERVEVLEGRMEITPTGAGTTVRIALPVAPSA